MPSIYVGTYAKYNNGSIQGAHLDPSDYTDKDRFLEACAELHKDEEDPEFMFQDWEGIPDGLIGESYVKDELWEWLALDEDDQELLKVYRDHVNQDGDIDEAREAFAGTFKNEEDWAYHFLEDTGMLADAPDTLKNYFDYEAYARDARLSGDVCFVHHNRECWAFYNH